MEELVQQIRNFAKERNWGQYHSPKNLAMALSVEVSELVEIFQWMREDESKALNVEDFSHLEEEIGDVMIYLTNLADKYGINPIVAAKKKMILSHQKYPVEHVNPSKGDDSNA